MLMRITQLTVCSLLVIFPVLASEYDPDPADGYVYQNPTIQGDLSQFEDEKVIVLYRGIHFLQDQYTAQECLDYVEIEQVGNGLYSSASYELADIPYDCDDYGLLQAHSGQVQLDVNALFVTDPIAIRERIYSTHRYAFQQLYSNDYKSFHQQLTEATGQYLPIFEDFTFSRNPMLSFSDRIKHPGKYGFGLKNYGASKPRLPQYRLTGEPANPFLGKLYGIVLDEAAVEELMPLNVAKAHNSNEIRLYTHFRNDILSEREISLAGYVPGDYVVFEMPLQAPSFNHAHYPYYEKKYGLTKKRFDNYKAVFTSAATSATKKKSTSQSLLQSLIEAERQDNKLIYKNCIVPKVKDLFDKELNLINARQSSLELDRSLTPIN